MGKRVLSWDNALHRTGPPRCFRASCVRGGEWRHWQRGGGPRGDEPLPAMETMMAEDQYGLREGEVTVALPAATDAGVYFIGRIRTPWSVREECPKNARGSDAVCTIEVDPRFAGGLHGVDSCSHLMVLYWMDRARRDLLLQSPHSYDDLHGTFSLRSPARPNPIAVSVVALKGVSGSRLAVVGLDCLDGTPLIDIKPYFASTDAVPDAVVGWRRKERPPA